MLDQTLLPNEVVWLMPETAEDIFKAIKELKVRGAPAIGIAGAFGLYLGLCSSADLSREAFGAALVETADYLKSSRPTAVNLAWAIDRVAAKVAASEECSVPELLRLILEEALAIREEDEAMCLAIGRHGAALLKDAGSILTHCNAGTIATARYGTALSPVYFLAEQGTVLQVFADETRPLLQGARLTAWELQQAGIPVTLITDNMAATVMARGMVKAVIVGADRIAANGDTANKIGTYGLAILAREHGLPFYVAAPSSTFDLSLGDGSGIPIEERDGEEVAMCGGRRIAPVGAGVFNPAFDVTPARYITAIITERGVLYPSFAESIREMFKGSI